MAIATKSAKYDNEEEATLMGGFFCLILSKISVSNSRGRQPRISDRKVRIKSGASALG